MGGSSYNRAQRELSIIFLLLNTLFIYLKKTPYLFIKKKKKSRVSAEQKSWDLEDSGQKHPYPMLQIFTKKPSSSDSRFSIHFSRIRDKTAVSLNYPLLKFGHGVLRPFPVPICKL